MRFAFYLSLRNLTRHPGRNILYVLGVSITAALLLDMILLSGGISVTLGRMLRDMGYEIRISPRGTLPFETEAQILHYQEIRRNLQQVPGVRSVHALLGASVSVDYAGETFSSFAMGLQLKEPVVHRILQGREPSPEEHEVLVNQYLADAKQIKPGTTLKLWVGSQSQAMGAYESTPVKVTGVAHFPLDAEGQYTISCSIPLLQELIGQKLQDPVSAILIKVHKPDQAQSIVDKINTNFPQVSAYTIDTVIEIVDRQLSYFKQFAYILGGISLVVTFVLVFIITTISFHDRLGEIALLRAIGLSHKTIFSTILFEGILTSFASAAFGFVLGKFVSLYLDAILTSAPGLPEEFSFFVMQPASVIKAFGVLIITGFFAGIYPAAAAVRLPVAETLREEIL